MSSSVFNGQETVIEEFQFNMDDAEYKRFKQFCYDNAGLPYGTLSVLGLAVVLLAAAVGIKMNNPFKDAGKTYVCSVLVAQFLNSIGKTSVNVDNMTPKDMYPIVKGLSKDL
jgi:hypothetical protein